ncbi:MAG: ribosome small subunit-dependent GTPase A [Flammeovirgaceae bacterium]|nr:ribosome small subunit-dependent GTPase A [Flammeovirgaceae bacterium]HCX24895.1 ribosome small subunit-dependent GTPase A [Cytophagales bacterium]
MTLKDIGYTPILENYRIDHSLDTFDVARVIAEHKERYVVKTISGEYEAEILGNMRFTAQSRADFPAVGDWVAVSLFDEKALIHQIYPRSSLIERQAVGKHGDKQIIAANVDYALIVQAVDRDFNLNRFERYLTICYQAGVEPVLLLSKVDLIEHQERENLLLMVRKRIPDVPVFAISNETNFGIETLKQSIEKGKTYCLLGSSGVGKSTLLNTIFGTEVMKTDAISAHADRGRHVTTHREMRCTPEGGIVIDNPGMREVGIADAGEGLETTFSVIAELAEDCKFKDCTHQSETGCAVLEALECGDLDEATYANYLRMMREKQHFETSALDKRRKDKLFGRMMKNYKKGGYNKYD